MPLRDTEYFKHIRDECQFLLSLNIKGKEALINNALVSRRWHRASVERFLRSKPYSVEFLNWGERRGFCIYRAGLQTVQMTTPIVI